MNYQLLLNGKTEVLILGVCLEIFFLNKRGKKLGCVLYTGAHYTRVNTVYENYVWTMVEETNMEVILAVTQ